MLSGYMYELTEGKKEGQTQNDRNRDGETQTERQKDRDRQIDRDRVTYREQTNKNTDR